MSCGAALVNLRLAAAHFGHATSAEIVPGHRRDGLLARVRLEERCASTPEAEELFRAIPRRRTNRLPLDGRDPPRGLVTALLREAHREGVSLRAVEAPERRVVADLIAEGDGSSWSSSRFRRELAAWTRSNGTGRRDGIPGYAHGLSDAAAFLHPVLVRLQNRARAEADRDRRRALGTKALLVLSTPRDGEAEWLRAGEALQRVLLRATACGLFASYFAQPIENPTLRSRLAEAIGERGVPQVMFRLGYGLEPRPTPRRRVDDVLRRMEPSGRRAERARGPDPGPRAGVGTASRRRSACCGFRRSGWSRPARRYSEPSRRAGAPLTLKDPVPERRLARARAGTGASPPARGRRGADPPNPSCAGATGVPRARPRRAVRRAQRAP